MQVQIVLHEQTGTQLQGETDTQLQTETQPQNDPGTQSQIQVAPAGSGEPHGNV